MSVQRIGDRARPRRVEAGSRHLRLAPGSAAGRVALPAQPTPLIGREADVAAIRALLWRADVRLLTLVGPGGAGKTRLALAAAETLAPDFTDGACFVDLAPLADPALVPDAIAHALAVRPRPDLPPLDGVREALRDRDLLLLLDNCEHLPEAARAIADLLASCPALTILATSRTPLRLRWSHQYGVAPLPPPPEGGLPPADLAANPAVALFLERARASAPAFALTPENGGAVAAICARLDGLPLAIEMAAAQVRTLSPQALLKRLTDRFDILRSDLLDRPSRHHTLAATIAWSVELLAPPERALFRRLAVFPAGCTLAAADAVCGEVRSEKEEVRKAGEAGAVAGSPPPPFSLLTSHFSLPDALATLAEHSLLTIEEDPDGEPRYRMLATVREYAAERLAESGEGNDCRRRHAAYLVALAERAEPELTGPEQMTWLATLARERENIRAALGWAIATGEAALGLRLAAALWWGWYLRGDLREGSDWLARLLALPGEEDSAARAGCLLGAGTLAYQLGELGRARDLGEAGLALARRAGARHLQGIGLNLLGGLALSGGDGERGQALYEEAVTLYRRKSGGVALTPREIFGLALSLTNLGVIAARRGDLREGIRLQEESLALTRRLGDRQGTAHALLRLGEAVRQDGRGAYARALMDEAAALFRDLGDLWGLGRAQLAIAGLALDRRDLACAAGLIRESLERFTGAGIKLGIATSWETAAALALARGEPARAARLLGAASALRSTIGAPPSAAERAEHEQIAAACRDLLGAEGLATAQQIGAARTPEATSAEVLAEPGSDTPTAVAAPVTPRPTLPVAENGASTGLTRRERELLPYLAQGLSNRAIGETLSISVRTVEMHIANLLAKLELTNRAQIAAWAAAHGLADPAARV